MSLHVCRQMCAYVHAGGDDPWVNHVQIDDNIFLSQRYYFHNIVFPVSTININKANSKSHWHICYRFKFKQV